MKLALYSNIFDFSEDVMEILLQNEAENNLIISNCLRGMDGKDTSDWFMGVVKDDIGTIRLLFLMTPPHNILLYKTDSIISVEALGILVKQLVDIKVRVSGVLAEKALANAFADLYSVNSGTIGKTVKNTRIYTLTRVNDVYFSPGKIRLAEFRDLYFLPYWHNAFSMDCHNPAEDLASTSDKIKRLIFNRNLYIWEDEVPVSQAAVGRRTLNGAIINDVYTPPFFRGNGYATSCVASLSQKCLDYGYKFCSLFTDLANPVSNSIYMKIGYEPVVDCDEICFE